MNNNSNNNKIINSAKRTLTREISSIKNLTSTFNDNFCGRYEPSSIGMNLTDGLFFAEGLTLINGYIQ